MSNQALANSELAIMNLLWGNEQLTAREIREQLYSDSGKAQHGTVQRLLQRLEEKGFVNKDSSGFVYLFSAKINRKSYAGMQLEELADKVTDGSLAPMITHLVENKKINKGEIDRIRAILDEMDEGLS